eukprot:14094394-Ditylum_brightwellii.AAC.1
MQKGEDQPSLVNETCSSCKEDSELLNLGCDLDIPYSELDSAEIQVHLTKAGKDFKSAQKHAAEFWDEYLDDMALQQNAQNTIEIATLIKILGT